MDKKGTASHQLDNGHFHSARTGRVERVIMKGSETGWAIVRTSVCGTVALCRAQTTATIVQNVAVFGAVWLEWGSWCGECPS